MMKWHEGIGKDVGYGAVLTAIAVSLVWLTATFAPVLSGALAQWLRVSVLGG